MGLVEKAQETFDAKEAERLQEKIADQSLNLRIFLKWHQRNSGRWRICHVARW